MTVNYLPPPRPLPEQRVQQLREHLEQFVVAEREREPVRKRRWRRPTFLGGVGAAILVAAGTGTAVAYVLLHPKPVTNHFGARCYTVATYTPGSSFPGTTVDSPNGGGTPAGIPLAIDHCAALWAAGILQAGVVRPVTNPLRHPYPVPALVGCTLPNGQAAILPGPPTTCERLGLPAQTPVPVLTAQPTPAQIGK